MVEIFNNLAVYIFFGLFTELAQKGLFCFPYTDHVTSTQGIDSLSGLCENENVRL